MTTLFWDKNIGPSLPRALQLLRPPDATTRYYLEQFPNTGSTPEVGDEAWLRYVGERGWFVISQDHRLHRKPNELYALKQHDVGCFYLWGANAQLWEIFNCFVRALDRIIEAASNTPPPFIYRVNWEGTLTRVTLS